MFKIDPFKFLPKKKVNDEIVLKDNTSKAFRVYRAMYPVGTEKTEIQLYSDESGKNKLDQPVSTDQEIWHNAEYIQIEFI